MRKKISTIFSFIPIIFLPFWRGYLVDKNIVSFDVLLLLLPLVSIIIFFTIMNVLKFFKIE